MPFRTLLQSFAGYSNVHFTCELKLLHLPFLTMIKSCSSAFFLKNFSSFAFRKYSSTVTGELSYFHRPHHNPLIATTFPRILEKTYSLYGEREAVVDCEQNIRKTYKEYIDDIEKVATGFVSLGLQHGDRLGIFAPNCYQWLTVQFAAAISGLILVAINPTSKPKELEHCLKATGVRALVAAEKVRDSYLYPVIHETIPGMVGKTGNRIQQSKFPNLENIIMISSQNYDGTLRLDDIASDGNSESRKALTAIRNKIQTHDPVYILFTSGTTGLPKACLLSHHATSNVAYLHGNMLDFDKKRHVLCVSSPLFHGIGIAPTLTSMYYGQKLVFPSPSYNSQKMLQALHNERCTMMFGTPTMYIDIINHKEFDKFDLSALDTGVIGGSSTSKETFNNIFQKLGGANMMSGYGCTESTFVISISERGDSLDFVRSTVGKAFAHLEIKIVDGEGNLVPWGTPGELLFRGFNTMLGYFNDPETTKETLTADRFYKTGDLATLKSDGTVTIVGRIKDMILRGGENVYPKEIEDVIVAHPNVMEAHVFGIPEERLGEVVCAWVLPKHGKKVTPEEIISFCKEEMAHYKVPLHVRIVNAFPLLGTGKVNKVAMTKEMSQMLTNKV